MLAQVGERLRLDYAGLPFLARVGVNFGQIAGAWLACRGVVSLLG